MQHVYGGWYRSYLWQIFRAVGQFYQIIATIFLSNINNYIADINKQ